MAGDLVSGHDQPHPGGGAGGRGEAEGSRNGTNNTYINERVKNEGEIDSLPD